MDRKQEVVTDEDGQPFVAFNYHRNVDKALNALNGICAGVMADGKLTDTEIVFLHRWLSDHGEVRNKWPASVVFERVDAALEDGYISDEERRDLMTVLSDLIGGAFTETDEPDGGATRLPADDNPIIEFTGKRFCFTGKFVYGTRAKCQQIVIDRGAEISKNVVQKLDYLVIGELASRDWINTSHGRKIEKAVSFKEKGFPVQIVQEEIWVSSL